MAQVVIWFRSDLRVEDNPALDRALAFGCKKALYLRTPKQWQAHKMAPIKQDFIDRHLALLAHQLAALDIELEIVTVADFSDQISYLQSLTESGVDKVFANSELELNEVQRDEYLVNAGVPLALTQADTILPLGQVTNQQGQMYRVFTPFKKAWLQQMRSHAWPLLETQAKALKFEETETAQRMSGHWCLADEYMQAHWPEFSHSLIHNYHEQRDIPSQPATSKLSPYLAIGAISVRTLCKELLSLYPDLLEQDKTGPAVWLSEIIWREFYRNLLYYYPVLIKGVCFNPKYDNLPWPDAGDKFEKWCQGKTGYPIVDAAMRQLNQTGWMHNRLRMIVASFLTKNLLVHWRLGEDYFMQQLIDGDFAANNGGWQWSASTGCDAQPYFRVFNPVSQSKKFDPNGEFIRKYLPELKNVPEKYIHEPQTYLAATGQAELYWPAIVDLKYSRQQAIEFYGADHDTREQAGMVAKLC